MFLRADAELVVEGNSGEVAAGYSPERMLPPALAFLSGHLAADLLHRVAIEAHRIDAPADLVLLCDGHLTADRYYRMLAADLGLPFAERPLRPSSVTSLARVRETGVLPLGENRNGWRYLVAPRGAALALFLTEMRDRNAAEPRLPVAMTTPDRLEALARHAQRRTVLRAASHGLPDWNGQLSARGGLSRFQAILCCALAAAVCTMAWVDPGACAAAIHVMFFIGFVLLVGFRITATAASPGGRQMPPRSARIPDDALPVYSVIVPLFRETRVVERLVAALGRLDYPVLGSKLT